VADGFFTPPLFISRLGFARVWLPVAGCPHTYTSSGFRDDEDSAFHREKRPRKSEREREIQRKRKKLGNFRKHGFHNGVTLAAGESRRERKKGERFSAQDFEDGGPARHHSGPKAFGRGVMALIPPNDCATCAGHFRSEGAVAITDSGSQRRLC
jgi:hypothetical protein